MPSCDTADPHSFSEPQNFLTTHIDLDLEARFERRVLEGAATLTIRAVEPRRDCLILDTRRLSVQAAEISSDGQSYRETDFQLGAEDPILGTPLMVRAPAGTTHVRIQYTTSPEASGLQWLEPAQTATRKFPFLFTQSQEIHARSWIPLQDTPAVRVTFSARIRVPEELTAVMGAAPVDDQTRGVYRFRMERPIPGYLIALAIGKLEFAATGPRTGVYAEPPVLASAVAEFTDTEQMVRTTEQLYGPYLWGRFDMLILPPSFPLGGMENPCVPFLTPTLIAGDKSLVSLVAHELAHSWSGNLVTNATWSDFWLNEGFTTYIEHRIQEAIYGADRALMEEVLSREALDAEMATLDSRDQILHIDLAGRDPDEGSTLVPYVKGALFLHSIEQRFGRDALDDFLRKYFRHFAFRSITTAEALEFLDRELLSTRPEIAAEIPVREWVEEPGLPASAPSFSAPAFDKVRKSADHWLHDEVAAVNIPARQWKTQEWLHFLNRLPGDLGPSRMAELDAAHHLTGSGNYEILQKWLLLAVRNGYRPAFPRVEEFLISVGRRKYVKPLYEELAKTPEHLELAQSIYTRARPRYHNLTRDAIDQVLARANDVPISAG